MRTSKGFTILELIVVIAVVALLASVALPKFYRLTLRAEALSAQGMIGTLRSALSMQMAQGLYQGADLAAWAHDGSRPLYPMHDLLLEQPKDYLGVLSDSDQRGKWFDDKQTHELVYVVRNDEIIHGITGTPKKVRWRIFALHEQMAGGNQLVGLLLQPVIKPQWMFE
jgi:prepilin-type N-terminal cleavage/methylation domain-containing protein